MISTAILISASGGVITLFTYLNNKKTNKEKVITLKKANAPQFDFKIVFKDKRRDDFFDDEIFSIEKAGIDLDIQGISDYKDKKIAYFELKNISNFSSYNLVIEYKIKFLKPLLKFGIDEADVDIKKNRKGKEKFKNFYTYEGVKKTHCVSKEENFIETFCYFDGNCSKAEIYITKMYDQENVYISKPILLKTYLHQKWGHLGDGVEFRKLVGAFKKKKNIFLKK